MAYEFEIETDLPKKPFVDNMGAEIIEFALGYDVDANHAAIMSVMLIPGVSYLDGRVKGVFDLRFGIRERDMNHEWKVSGPDFSVKSADKYIPKQYREVVLRLICESLGILIAHSTAEHLTMESYYPNLETKAIKKYRYICDNAKKYGFALKETFRDGNSGKDYWFLSRSN
jgi:hypothetical protein